MTDADKVPCPFCDGEGEVLDYDAMDIKLGQNEWVPRTTRQCPNCDGQGWKLENPKHPLTDPAP